jgi:hypothetical protein
MHDFSQKYRGAVFFGLGLEEKADGYGQQDALCILERAAKQTYDDDVRCAAITDALEYLSAFNPRKAAYRDFRTALDMDDPIARYHAVRHALVRIKVAAAGGH